MMFRITLRPAKTDGELRVRHVAKFTKQFVVEKGSLYAALKSTEAEAAAHWRKLDNLELRCCFVEQWKQHLYIPTQILVDDPITGERERWPDP